MYTYKNRWNQKINKQLSDFFNLIRNYCITVTFIFIKNRTIKLNNQESIH